MAQSPLLCAGAQPQGFGVDVEARKDPAVGANFAVLLIVRLGNKGKLEGSTTAYLPGLRRLDAALEA